MTATNHVQNLDNFKVTVFIRIDGHNCRAVVLRIAGIAIALITIIIKIVMAIFVNTR
jgi:hypothetical protein